MTDRYWHYRNPNDPSNEIEATAVHGEWITLAVGQEKAVDSYNEDFTCSISLSLGDARALGEWLIAQATA